MPRDFTPEALRILQRYGYRAEKVERYNTYARRSRDLFGFADLLALRVHHWSDPELLNARHSLQGTLYLQVCARTGFAAHLEKATTGPIGQALADCLLAGNRFEIWAFPSRAGSERHRYRQVQVGQKSLRVAKINFTQVTYDLVGDTFYTEDTTELVHVGYPLPSPSRT